MSLTEIKMYEVDLDLLDISRYNVRRTSIKKGLNELAESIRLIGVQQPILITPNNGKYDVIIGQRRVLASHLAGKKTIPAIIKKISNEKEACILSFSENILRSDLSSKDKMLFAQKMKSLVGSIKDIASEIGVSEQTIRNWLSYADVPDEIKKLVDSGQLSANTALRIIRKIGDINMAIEIAKRINEVPRGQDKHIIIQYASENPTYSIDKILNDSKNFKLEIKLLLTPKIASALNAASKQYNMEEEDIGLDALNDWLKERGFINE